MTALGPEQPRFCTRCGAPVGNDWDFCPRCGTRVASGTDVTVVPSLGLPAPPRIERIHPPSRAPIAAVVLIGCAAAITLCALFPAYYRGGKSLASSSENLWYNVPAIVAWVVAAVLLAVPSAAEVGSGLAVGATICWLPAYMSDIGSVIRGTAKPALGFTLGQLGIALALVGSAVVVPWLLRRRSSRVRGLALWAVGGATLGLLYDVGVALNWQRITIRATNSDWTFAGSGSAVLHQDCCTLVHARGWDLAQTLAVLVLAVVVPLLAAVIFPRRGFAGALAGIALVLAADPISEFVRLGGVVTAASIGMTPANISAALPIVTQQPLPGLWLAVLVPVVLLLIGIARLVMDDPDARTPRRDRATSFAT